MFSGRCESWSLEPPHSDELQPPEAEPSVWPITFNSISLPPQHRPTCGRQIVSGDSDAISVPAPPKSGFTIVYIEFFLFGAESMSGK
jgi:hypothetical protein